MAEIKEKTVWFIGFRKLKRQLAACCECSAITDDPKGHSLWHARSNYDTNIGIMYSDFRIHIVLTDHGLHIVDDSTHTPKLRGTSPYNKGPA